MIFKTSQRTLDLINEMEVEFEQAKPYQYGVKRQTFNFNDWINKVVFKNR